MNNKSISRRQLLKGGGALVVSFSFAGPVLQALAQDETPQPRPFASERVDLGTFVPEPGDYLDPRELDSWVAVLQDGSVTVFHRQSRYRYRQQNGAGSDLRRRTLRAFQPRDHGHGRHRESSGSGPHGWQQHDSPRWPAVAAGLRCRLPGTLEIGFRAAGRSRREPRGCGRRRQRQGRPLEERLLWRPHRREAFQREDHRQGIPGRHASGPRSKAAEL